MFAFSIDRNQFSLNLMIINTMESIVESLSLYFIDSYFPVQLCAALQITRTIT